MKGRMTVLLTCCLAAACLCTVPPEILAWADAHGGTDLHPDEVMPVASKLVWSRAAEISQDLDFFEIGSGCERLTRTLTSAGRKGKAFDKRRHPSENLCKLPGLLWAAVCTLRMKASSLLAAAPGCNTWGAPAEYHMQRRHVSVFGNEAREDVREANLFAIHLGWLITLAFMRKVYILIEQPRGSAFFNFPAITSFMSISGANKLLTYMGAFGQVCQKPTWLLTTLPLHACAGLIRQQPRTLIAPGDVHHKSKNKRWWASGKKMKNTEEYTQEYCDAVEVALQHASPGL